ncbi:hypothetical protein TNIN_220551 [Trichonephila inaurata madagascariensis]|uniref:Hedgehog N-terminal signalling domain-containing protein n=1 Tax=Trichonephila inaurata madagascariensis TaxID=2747483 RepID=A0A8X6XYT5_9ARAC|nr:hypothetical protein TNIN_220551 [Trichonephila inaurata madagascariensis]
MFPPHLALHFAFTGTLLLEAFISASACAPSFFSRRRGTRTGSPLVYKEHIPSTVEFSYAASGPPQGKITRHDPEFRDLIINYSQDVVFKDDEGDASDRVMSVEMHITDTGRADVGSWKGQSSRNSMDFPFVGLMDINSSPEYCYLTVNFIVVKALKTLKFEFV